MHGFITRLQRKLTQINLFKSGSTQTPIIQRERYSTRLYIFFLLLSVSIIILYTLSSKETKQKSIQTPSQLQYKQLTESYSSTLQCPCTQLSVVYKEFIKINASFHQVCTSDFIKDSWLDFLFGDGSWMIQERSDIRTRGIAYFTLLSSLCDLSKTTINTAIDEFLEQTLISAYMLPDVEFILQIEALTNHFKTITSNQFSHTAQLVRDLTHGSAYVSSYYLNWYYEVNDTSQKPILAKPVKLNQSCSCGTRNDCVEPGGIFLSGDGTRYFTIPGWNVGCSVTETLLRSTLECFYNASCIFLIQAYGRIIFQGLPGRANVTAMNASIPSRYASNVMIQNMVDLLFVEQWQVDKSYSAFYRRCSPSYCSYAIEERNSPLFILSRVLGLYGGLTISLRFIIPHLIRLVLHVKTRCHRNAVVPIA